MKHTTEIVEDRSGRGRFDGPLAIGGVGGSGTRVLSELFRAVGFDMGRTNHAGDHLLFSLLFKRPRWLCHADSEAVERAIGLFEKLVVGSGTFVDWASLAPALWERTRYRYNFNQSFAEKVALVRPFVSKGPASISPSGVRGWGWKEPNTHFLLEPLARHFPDMRYIHLMRNGLDMAFSANQNQVRIWGDRFGVTVPDDPDDLPRNSLAYWVRANRRAIDVGQRILGDRFMVVRFEELCAEPERIVPALLAFAGVDSDTVDLSALTQMPQTPSSVGRYRAFDLGVFDPADIQALPDLGYAINLEVAA